MINKEPSKRQIMEFEKTIHELRTDSSMPDFYASVTFLKASDKRVSIALNHYIITHYQFDFDYGQGTTIIYWLLKK